MKEFKVGQTWQGKTYADMINKVMDISYGEGYPKATVPTSEPGVVAWFAFIDGKARGPKKDWQWANALSKDESTIIEEYVGNDFDNAREKVVSLQGIFRKRFCFQRDPDGTGNKYKCKYIGYFELDKFDERELIRIHKRKGSGV
ncbi:MAG: hypothetical protein FWD58_09050 [Firmicutes bacterium]|nr:hypothetical protein [Bacillota bacterium]